MLCSPCTQTRAERNMRFHHEYSYAPFVITLMEMPYDSISRCHHQSMNDIAEPDFPHAFDIGFESSSAVAAGAEYGCNLSPEDRRSASVQVLHESILIMGTQTGTPPFQAATTSLPSGTQPEACFSPSMDISAASGGWTCARSPPTVDTQTMSRQQGQLLLRGPNNNEGWKSMSCAGISTMKTACGSLGVSHDAECMEQLLVHCMTAMESNDITLAQQLMWVLNNTVSTEGDPNQRVAAYFLRALIARAAKLMTSPAYVNALPAAHLMHARDTFDPSTRTLSAIELAGFVDLTPWHRFGFCATNGAIMEALEGKHSVHIVDFSITHCMQWPTLIEALSKRPHGPPCVQLTVHGARPLVPPLLNMSVEEVGMKLTAFARSKNVPFQFSVLPQEISKLTPSCIEVQEGEMLVINCQMRARYISDEAVGDGSGGCGAGRGTATQHLRSARAQFMRWIGAVRPDMVMFVDEDADMGSKDVVSRMKAAFNYLWIPYDAMDTFLPRESKQRMQYEGDIGSKIENIIACEGEERVERLESKEMWMHRLRMVSNLQSIQFSEAVVAEVKSMLEGHAAGWSLKKDGDSLLLTWKGHNAVFATACVSITTSSS